MERLLLVHVVDQAVAGPVFAAAVPAASRSLRKTPLSNSDGRLLPKEDGKSDLQDACCSMLGRWLKINFAELIRAASHAHTINGDSMQGLAAIVQIAMVSTSIDAATNQGRAAA